VHELDIPAPDNMKLGLPATGGASLQLFRSCSKQVAQCLHHPFILGLAQGTLDRWASILE
jgi:hypothetical protein